MTTGALIFAFNNDQIDYVSMAAWSAKNIERHLGIHTRIITDQDVNTVGTNSRYFSDYESTVTWHNETRTDAYELTPWDRTLVLDADYVVASDQLKVLLHADTDFLAHGWATDVTGLNDFSGLNYFGNNCMPMWWATVMLFRRSTQAQLIFETMRMIRQHWNHYRNLYKNSQPSYRNDHALTIALGIVNGHTLNHAGIPWNLSTVAPEHKLSQLDQDHYRVDFLTADQKSRYVILRNQDFHAMGKSYLGEIVANSC
jgi:hypothetical protein